MEKYNEYFELGVQMTESGATTIKVPKKLIHIFSLGTEGTRKMFGEEIDKRLHAIHTDPKTAKEMCLMVLSNLSDTYFKHLQTDSRDQSGVFEGFKSLCSFILIKEAGNKYKSIINLLIRGTLEGPIICIGENYSVNFKCNTYALADRYFGKGITSYTMETKLMKKRLSKIYKRQLKKAFSNDIARSVLKAYGLSSIPTLEEVKLEADRLVSLGYIKKGKKLAYQYRNKKSDKRFYVEDAIDIFKYLTEGGLRIPTISEKAGGRVTHSFNLLPEWIRAMITLRGEWTIECDYSCLHPNLANNIYKGSGKSITHQEASDYLDIPLIEAKKEHLSFFNKHHEQMKKSKLYDYYMETEKNMMLGIRNEKEQHGYKKTSRKLFALETKLMTKCIIQLERLGISTIYIYDALAVAKSNGVITRNIMNREAKRLGIKTEVKANTDFNAFLEDGEKQKTLVA